MVLIDKMMGEGMISLNIVVPLLIDLFKDTIKIILKNKKLTNKSRPNLYKNYSKPQYKNRNPFSRPNSSSNPHKNTTSKDN